MVLQVVTEETYNLQRDFYSLKTQGKRENVRNVEGRKGVESPSVT